MALFAFLEGTTVSQNSTNKDSAESDEPREPLEDRQPLDDYLELILEAEDHTPEEAGYGHGV
jgi:hypothetical protein